MTCCFSSSRIILTVKSMNVSSGKKPCKQCLTFCRRILATWKSLCTEGALHLHVSKPRA